MEKSTMLGFQTLFKSLKQTIVSHSLKTKEPDFRLTRHEVLDFQKVLSQQIDCFCLMLNPNLDRNFEPPKAEKKAKKQKEEYFDSQTKQGGNARERDGGESRSINYSINQSSSDHLSRSYQTQGSGGSSSKKNITAKKSAPIKSKKRRCQDQNESVSQESKEDKENEISSETDDGNANSKRIRLMNDGDIKVIKQYFKMNHSTLSYDQIVTSMKDQLEISVPSIQQLVSYLFNKLKISQNNKTQTESITEDTYAENVFNELEELKNQETINFLVSKYQQQPQEEKDTFPLNQQTSNDQQNNQDSNLPLPQGSDENSQQYASYSQNIASTNSVNSKSKDIYSKNDVNSTSKNSKNKSSSLKKGPLKREEFPQERNNQRQIEEGNEINQMAVDAQQYQNNSSQESDPLNLDADNELFADDFVPNPKGEPIEEQYNVPNPDCVDNEEEYDEYSLMGEHNHNGEFGIEMQNNIFQ